MEPINFDALENQLEGSVASALAAKQKDHAVAQAETYVAYYKALIDGGIPAETAADLVRSMDHATLAMTVNIMAMEAVRAQRGTED